MRGTFGIELPLSLMFDKRTLEGMASAVDEKVASTPKVSSGFAEEDLLAQATTLSDAELDALLRETLAEGGHS